MDSIQGERMSDGEKRRDERVEKEGDYIPNRNEECRIRLPDMVEMDRMRAGVHRCGDSL